MASTTGWDPSPPLDVCRVQDELDPILGGDVAQHQCEQLVHEARA